MGRLLGRDARLGLSHTVIIEFTLYMENINPPLPATIVSCTWFYGNFSVWELGPGKQDFGDALREVLPDLDPCLGQAPSPMRATRESVRWRNVCGRLRELVAWRASWGRAVPGDGGSCERQVAKQ